MFILFIIRTLCYCVLDLVPDPDGCDSWEDGSPGHSVPGAGQHLQQRHHQHSQGGGTHRYRGLDVGMHPLRVRGSG